MESELIQTLKSVTESINALAQPRFIDWLAVILSLFSITVSGAAILFAVRVANKQNKIALFDKRFSAFSIIIACIGFGKSLKAIDPDDPNANRILYDMFVDSFSNEIHCSRDIDYMLTYIKNELGKLILLFKLNEEEKSIISNSAMTLIAIMTTQENLYSNEWCNNAISFSNWMDNLEKNTIRKMAKILKLSK